LNLEAERLALLDLGGGAVTTLTDSAFAGHGSLSPDGRFAVYAAGPHEATHIFVQPVAGGPSRRITWVPGANESPLWAPDGSAVAFLNRVGIWVVPMADGTPTDDVRLALSASGINLLNWTTRGPPGSP
jgi:Tol biopolymer transport system component